MEGATGASEPAGEPIFFPIIEGEELLDRLLPPSILFPESCVSTAKVGGAPGAGESRNSAGGALLETILKGTTRTGCVLVWTFT